MNDLPTSVRAASPRARWRMLTLALMAALVVYGGILLVFRFAALMPAPPPPAPLLRSALLAIGAALLAGAVAWSYAMLPAEPGESRDRNALEAEARRFLVRSLIGSAIAEAGGLAGFTLAFLGGTLAESLALLGGSLIVQAVVLLPRGEAYWRAFEERLPPRPS